MKKSKLVILCLLVTTLAVGQSENEGSLGQMIDDLTYKWDLESSNLNSYKGLTKFCTGSEYRTEIINMLNEIHHYDSVLYDRLKKAAVYNHDKELEKTIKDIASFEKEYSMKQFIRFLHDECSARNEVEKHSKELKNDIGENSYDGQVYIIETELNKYIKHITKRMDNIRNHVHHLKIK